jgi:hypothetical protein
MNIDTERRTVTIKVSDAINRERNLNIPDDANSLVISSLLDSKAHDAPVA